MKQPGPKGEGGGGVCVCVCACVCVNQVALTTAHDWETDDAVVKAS